MAGIAGQSRSLNLSQAKVTPLALRRHCKLQSATLRNLPQHVCAV